MGLPPGILVIGCRGLGSWQLQVVCWGGGLPACSLQQVTLPTCAENLCPLPRACRPNSPDKVPGQARPMWI